MRYSRLRKKRTTPRYASVFITIIVIVTIFYFSTATMMGNWVAKNIVSPLVNRLESVGNPLDEDNSDSDSINDNEATESKDSENGNSTETNKITESMDMSGFTIYAIQMGAFNSEDNAKTEAENVKAKKGAGYIIKDKLFRVLASAYRSQEDAQNVKEQLKDQGIDSQIYPLNINGVNIQITAGEEKVKNIKNAFEKWVDLGNEIGDLSIDFDRNEMQVSTATKQLSKVKDDMESISTILEEYASGNEDNLIYKGLKDLYSTGLDDLNKILEENYTNAVEFSSEIKYTYIKMMHDYAKYIQKITNG